MNRWRQGPSFLLSALAISVQPAAHAGMDASLPPPTGPYAVGRVTFQWTDPARVEVLAPCASPRELMVDVWYPAEASSGRSAASYLPDFTALVRAVGEERLRTEFGPAYETLAKGLLRTHAREGAPFAGAAGPCPVLVFSHGFGMLSRTYTAQLEDLASHGYVVAAIAHTHETMVTVFPDGRAVAFAVEPWSKATTSEAASIAYENGRMRWWARDMSFVLDSLPREEERRAPFAGHLDLRKVGAFGHSSGGRAAARAGHDDPRIRACLNQDGLARNLPFDRESISRLEQPFLLFTRPRPARAPTDDELAQMGLSRSGLQSLIQELDAQQDAAMESTGRGSYRVTLAMAGISHSSFGDQPLLQAVDERERRQAQRHLGVIRSYTLAFFDKTLRGAADTVLDRTPEDETITVEPFPRARRGSR